MFGILVTMLLISIESSAPIWFWWIWRRSSAWASVRWFSTCASTASFVNSWCWFMRPFCYRIVNTNSTIVNFHPRTWFLSILCISHVFEVHETKTTRSASLWWGEIQLENLMILTNFFFMSYLCIKNNVDSLNFAIFWENFMNFVFFCVRAEPEYA